MRSIYGTRSIVPNNYYFTFDKIYKDEKSLNHSDQVLIGRTVLARAEKTVHIKTNNGYIKIAKLDDSGRFIYFEGKCLEKTDDIDLIHSKGNSYNDDGTYIVDGSFVQGTFPIPKGVSENNYKPRKFLLEQYSNKPSLTFSVINNKEAKKYFQDGVTLYDENHQPIQTTLEAIEQNVSGSYRVVSAASVETFQVMTDISTYAAMDNQSITNTTNINHKYKTFFRKGTFTYTLAKETNESIYTYTYDSSVNKMIGTGEPQILSVDSTYLFIKVSTWENKGKWEDASEWYTGYLGALNGTGFNHTNVKFNDASGTYLTLVDAINQLDKVIGSTNLRFGKGDNFVNTPDNGLASGTDANDNRPINIREATLADAIVRHDADIGEIETLTNDDALNNIEFTKESTDTSGTGLDTIGDTKFTAQSLTNMIKILDKIIGIHRNINDSYDNRPVTLQDTETLVENIRHNNANIGKIESINGDNLRFDKDVEPSDDATTGPATIESATDAIKTLDNIIGTLTTVTNLHEVGNNNGGSATDLVNAISILKGYIGTIGNLQGEANGVNQKNLVNAIEALNKIIGDATIIHKEDSENDNTNDIYIDDNGQEPNLVSSINKLDNLIGTIKALHNVNNDNINNIKLSSLAKTINKLDSLIGGLNKLNNNPKNLSEDNDRNNLTTAINKLDHVIGSWSSTGWHQSLENSDLIEGKTFNDMVSYLENVDQWLQKLQEKKVNISTFNTWIELINNLGENMDILDANITTLYEQINNSDNTNSGCSSINLTWGTF